MSSPKGDTAGPPPAMTNNADSGSNNDAMMMMMEMMMSSQQQAINQAPQAPAPMSVPEIVRTEEVDWTEKMDQLMNKTRADYTLDKARKHGRLDTIHTSPLLDEEDATTTGQL